MKNTFLYNIVSPFGLLIFLIFNSFLMSIIYIVSINIYYITNILNFNWTGYQNTLFIYISIISIKIIIVKTVIKKIIKITHIELVYLYTRHESNNLKSFIWSSLCFAAFVGGVFIGFLLFPARAGDVRPEVEYATVLLAAAFATTQYINVANKKLRRQSEK